MSRLLQTLRGQKSVERLCDHTYLASLPGSDSTVLYLRANKGRFCSGMISRYRFRVLAVEPVSESRADIAHSPRGATTSHES